MSLWRLNLFFLCACIASFCSPVFAATAEQLMEKAKNLEANGNAAEAIDCLDQAIAKGGAKRPGVFWLRGFCHQAMRQHQEAIVDFNKALKLCEQQKKLLPMADKVYFSRGSSYMALKQDSKALDDFNQLMTLNKAMPQAYVSRGNIYMRLKQYQKAIDDYSKALRLRVVMEDRGRVLLSRAKAYEALGKYNMAKMDRLKLKELEKDFDLDGGISLHKR